MSSYSQTIQEVEAIFASPTWVSNDIKAYSSNVTAIGTKPAEYVVLELLPAQPLEIQYGDAQQVSGLIIIQIYTQVNTGSRRTYEISDLLDEVLQRQSLGISVQTHSSALNVKGNDPDDPTRFRADYVLRFTSY